MKIKQCGLCSNHTASRASVVHHIETKHRVTARQWMLDSPDES